MCSVCTKYSHGIIRMYVNLTKLYISYTHNYRNLSYLARLFTICTLCVSKYYVYIHYRIHTYTVGTSVLT